jgi:hypothetical protein
MASLRRPAHTPDLRISREPPPAFPVTAASNTIWRDGEGDIVAFGGTLEDSRWMTVLRVGSFEFTQSNEPIVGHPDEGVSDELVEDAYRRTVLPLALQALGSEVLHASAVSGPDGVLALCAVSGTGKSTLASALSRRGYPLWADDAVRFEPAGRAIAVTPLPFALRLKGESLTLFGDVEVPSSNDASPQPLGAIYILERGDELALSPMPPADAFPAVLTHAYCFDLTDAARKREMMAAYLDVASRVPIYRLVLPEGLRHIDAVVDAVRESSSS